MYINYIANQRVSISSNPEHGVPVTSCIVDFLQSIDEEWPSSLPVRTRRDLQDICRTLDDAEFLATLSSASRDTVKLIRNIIAAGLLTRIALSTNHKGEPLIKINHPNQ